MIFSNVLIVLINSCSIWCVLIRFDNLNELYKGKHKSNNYLSSDESDIDTFQKSDEIQITKLCSRIIDTNFFKNRMEFHFDVTSEKLTSLVRKYHKKFFRKRYKTIYVRKEICCFPFREGKLVKIEQITYKIVQVGEEKMKEKVFPCFVQDKRSNFLEQIWISRRYFGGMYFVFKYDHNQKLKLFALVEDVPLKPISGDLARTLMLKIINTQDRTVHELSVDEKLRMCNMIINSGRIPMKQFKFSPHKANLLPEYVDFVLTNELPPELARVGPHMLKIRGFGCKALHISKNKLQVVYISDFIFWQNLPRNPVLYMQRNGTKNFFQYMGEWGLIVHLTSSIH